MSAKDEMHIPCNDNGWERISWNDNDRRQIECEIPWSMWAATYNDALMVTKCPHKKSAGLLLDAINLAHRIQVRFEGSNLVIATVIIELGRALEAIIRVIKERRSEIPYLRDDDEWCENKMVVWQTWMDTYDDALMMTEYPHEKSAYLVANAINLARRAKMRFEGIDLLPAIVVTELGHALEAVISVIKETHD